MATTQPAIYPASFEIVVPARNEAGRLPEGLAALCRKAATLPVRTAILVVDSASTDATGHVVRNWAADPVPVRLLRCQQAGKGIAVRAGCWPPGRRLSGTATPTWPRTWPRWTPRCDCSQPGTAWSSGRVRWTASVVEDRRSAARRVGAAVFRTLARGIVPGVTDTQCGFKFFSGPLARAAALPLRTAGFAFDIELIVNCLRLARRSPRSRSAGRDVPGSTFSVRRHSTSAFRDIASIWLRSRISGGGQLPARHLPPRHQELPSADLGDSRPGRR